MDTIAYRKKMMQNLKQRAAKRAIAYPSKKDNKDVIIENEYFDTLKQKVYKQITEEK